MAEKLLDKLKELWGKITDWWNKYDSKQKTGIIVIAVGVITAFIILYAVLTSPNYVVLDTYDSTKETSQVTGVLSSSGISYKVSDDGLTVKIPKKEQSSARVALGASGISVSAYSIEEAVSRSLTTTEADIQKKYRVYLEDKLEKDIVEAFSDIEYAKVELTIPTNDGTLLAKDEEPTAALAIKTTDNFDSSKATSLAKFVATAIGSNTTDNITIIDTSGKSLFTGEDITSAAGNASTQLGVKKEAENLINADVKKVLSGTGPFGDVKVSSNMVIDFSTTEKTDHDYTPADGQSQGVLSEESGYTSESNSGSGGVPGTDSNSETTQYYADNANSSSTVEEFYKKYLPNESLEYVSIPPGTVKYSESSLAVSSTKYIMVEEDEIKRQGLLNDITWEEYKAANSERREVEVTDNMISLASGASGIPENRITIVAYEENFFIDSEGLGIDIYDVLQIALIVIILILLAVVVFRSMRSEKQPDSAEELSVETLLQSNPEPVLDDIEYEESSETKKLIEKFVDENPEAAANLLRNWLNEEWG